MIQPVQWTEPKKKNWKHTKVRTWIHNDPQRSTTVHWQLGHRDLRNGGPLDEGLKATVMFIKREDNAHETGLVAELLYHAPDSFICFFIRTFTDILFHNLFCPLFA